MMDRDTVQSEENQSGLRRRDLLRARDIIVHGNKLWGLAHVAWLDAEGLSDELGEFCDAISSAIGRLEKSIEGDR
jgi:hypothetical protein